MKKLGPTNSREPRLSSGVTSPAGESGQILVELGCWILGTALIVTYFLAVVGLERQRTQGIDLFTQAQAQASVSHGLENLPLPGQTAIRQEAVSEQEAVPEAVPAASSAPADNTDSMPIAVLRIAKLSLEVPVYSDPSELNLSRGAGWIDSTSAPNTGGNTAIAAHRDRYFRPLKDIQVGDIMELESHADRGEFRVSKISIVDPDDVSVLGDTPVSTLTLVTCYPFYFVGNAPQRYIVQAVAVDHAGNAATPGNLPPAPPSGETP